MFRVRHKTNAKHRNPATLREVKPAIFLPRLKFFSGNFVVLCVLCTSDACYARNFVTCVITPLSHNKLVRTSDVVPQSLFHSLVNFLWNRIAP